MWTNFITAWFLLAVLHAAASSSVMTTHGPIEGTTLTLFNGKKVEEYLGVPYAAPPIGQNRFAPPQPLASWNETLETKKISMICPQIVTEQIKKTMWYYSDLPQSEDCLYLNIRKPQGVSEKIPIMIWIHGGGFIAGSSSMPMYNASFLASENNVIVASMNYRLGMFGFSYLNNSVPGNAGIQDQIQAIKWIRDNAAAFGGDPDRITLFGQSAGSLSVNLHLLNKNMSSMFRNGILESGVIIIPLATFSTSDAQQVFLQLSKEVECPVDDQDAMLDCLRSKPTSSFQNMVQGLMTNGHITYGPVRNGLQVPLDVSNIAQLVPDRERKNVMIGNVPIEPTFSSVDFFPGKPLTDNFTVTQEEMTNLVKFLFQLRDERLMDIFLHEYKSFDGSYNSSNVRTEIFRAISDAILQCPQIFLSKQWITNWNKVFYYVFSHRPSVPLKYQIPEWVGPIHGDDITFVFGTPLDPGRGYSEEDKKLSKTIMKYWSNFAKTGDPNGFQSDLKEVYWPSVTPGGNFTHLEFEQNKIESKSLLGERPCEFWGQIYPDLLSIQQQLDATKR